MTWRRVRGSIGACGCISGGSGRWRSVCPTVGSGYGWDTTLEKAVREFEIAFICLHGAHAEARINFPDLPPVVLAHTADLQEVYAAAVSHANRPSSARPPAAALLLPPRKSSTGGHA
uniref:AP2/ERF domain-containing protein n=1 Tax=Oryza brachyantha TaxID=4533 RepID=J3MC05_ORYBR